MTAIDVWAQITTERMAKRPWLETLLRWTGRAAGELQTVEEHGARDGRRRRRHRAVVGLARTRRAALISNEEVAPPRSRARRRAFAGLATVDLGEAPMEDGARDPALGRPARPLSGSGWCRGCGDCRRTTAATIPSMPPASRCRRGVLHPDRPHWAAAALRDGPADPLSRGRHAWFPDSSWSAAMSGFPGSHERGSVTMTVKFPNFHVDTSGLCGAPAVSRPS